MPRTDDAPFPIQRLHELAARADKTGRSVFSPFLTPPEAQEAAIAARKQGVSLSLFGGYEDAERQMAAFFCEDAQEAPFPIKALEVTWPHQSQPSHRDLLGSVMGLGIQRQALGDIVLLEGCAYLFAQDTLAAHIAAQWSQAGRVSLQIALTDSLPELAAAAGTEHKDTVASLRLDAVLASGLHVSRTKAAEWVETGHVKLRYLPTLRSDARVDVGDVISVRGMGRLQLIAVGNPTRKDRLPITLMRFGIRKS